MGDAGAPRLTRRQLLAGAGAALLSVAGRAAPRPARGDRVLAERWSWAMGQAVRVRLFADSEQRGYEAAAAALEEIRRIERRLSVFDPASDLSELNRLAGRRPMRVDRDLATVLGLALRFRSRTGGAFDPAVEPLMRAWGFRGPRAAPPTAPELAEARRAVRAAEIGLAGGTAFLPCAPTQLDFGGIGVGYALDRAGAMLRARGISSALLEISGDVLAIGAPPGEMGWRVAVAGPGGRVVTERRLRDAALTTSSNSRSVRRYGSRLVGHVMDPVAGEPAASAARQVTVVAASGTAADALATAALVCGRAPGARELIEWG